MEGTFRCPGRSRGNNRLFQGGSSATCRESDEKKGPMKRLARKRVGAGTEVSKGGRDGGRRREALRVASRLRGRRRGSVQRVVSVLLLGMVLGGCGYAAECNSDRFPPAKWLMLWTSEADIYARDRNVTCGGLHVGDGLKIGSG
ncbi:hypothetical protein H6P81_017299 [Aristolochia fimbriata]|uniref:Uncharacterized protein n=1 Tax=Aristolochia fimbriata TaxID=158543 RepID=A0AAV7DZR4_ARIFI|nr:hypothetical protein H6P81_017299 [Aristolochia fimbriata]